MRKSHWINLILTVILGPLGLFYASAWQAVILIVIVLASTPWLSPGGMLLFWGLSIALGVSAVSERNKAVQAREDLDERRHQELIRATRQGAGQ